MNKRVFLAGCVVAGAMLLTIPAGAAEKENHTKEKTQKEVEEEEGKVLNIFSWNKEFQNRMEDFYPGYEIIDDSTGMIGEVTVRWQIISAEDNDYQKELDTALLNQDEMEEDERVDLFLVEEDYAQKYADTDYTKSLTDLGITEANTAGQFAFTKSVVTDSRGNIKGTSWQACPGVMIYNREIAKEVLGTDDPEDVQKILSDWDAFLSVADTMKEAGYYMTASVYDLYRVFSSQSSVSWVENGEMKTDDNIRKWAEISKTMLEKEETTADEMWSDSWSEGFYRNGKVFCYFGPSWFYEYCMDADAEDSIAGQGGWAVAEGPQSFSWGGTWLCAAEGTDNVSLIKNIMLKLTCDKEILTGIARTGGEFVNHVSVVKTLAEEENESFCSDVLGGQNPISILLSSAREAAQRSSSSYDYVCDREYQDAMKNYFAGTESYEEAEGRFFQAVTEVYPALKY